MRLTRASPAAPGFDLTGADTLAFAAGVYLTYLTFIEDGNPNFLPGDGGRRLINFAKWTKAAVVMREIQGFQQMPYK